MIDVKVLPERVMLDSSVLTLTRADATGPEADLCRELYHELVRNRRTILIATPALAEFVRHPPHRPPPRHRSVEIIAFDEPAAMILGTSLPKRVFLEPQGPEVTAAVAKSDSLIIACALRGAAGGLISRDRRQINLAREARLQAWRPADLVVGGTSSTAEQPPPGARG